MATSSSRSATTNFHKISDLIQCKEDSKENPMASNPEYASSSSLGPAPHAPNDPVSTPLQTVQSNRSSKSAPKTDKSLTDKSSTDKKKQAKQRITFKRHEIECLDRIFLEVEYPEADLIDRLAQELSLPTNNVKVWFQNKRSRQRKRQQILGVVGARSTNAATEERHKAPSSASNNYWSASTQPPDPTRSPGLFQPLMSPPLAHQIAVPPYQPAPVSPFYQPAQSSLPFYAYDAELAHLPGYMHMTTMFPSPLANLSPR
ncbi:hypothetical protein CAPTEDRAFT_228623 [Capitella teleta]|uniref:Homeobox domain-containing protein n=1 Tax=Capitella teleta TaxID=283909 RepID=R7TVE3_CAPTE|nr:hypothetical protein CAPTEDRAFT_228623 [Capitella teleta]|eukprot:ELT97557.1 hypothetical protein CAPTEDRAFT_228623 [Capitella teleta]